MAQILRTKSCFRSFFSVLIAVLPPLLLCVAFLHVKTSIRLKWESKAASIAVGDLRSTVEAEFGGHRSQRRNGNNTVARYSPPGCPLVLEVIYDSKNSVLEKKIVSSD